MPIIEPEEQTALPGLGPRAPEPIGAPPSPTFGETLGAAWDELSVNLYRDWRTHREGLDGIEDDPNYDPFSDIGGYENFADRFTFSRSAGETWRIKNRIDQEQRRNEILANSGWMGLATQIGVGLVDPVNLIPFGGVAYRGARMARPLLSSVAEGALAGAGGALAYEAIAQPTTETRTAMDALFNVSASTVLGGILGGAVGLVRKGAVPTSLDAMEAGLRSDFERAEGGGRGGLSAQSAVNTTLADEGAMSALGAEKLLTRNIVAVDPVAKLLESPSVQVRRIIQDLAETPLRIAKNAQGLASSIAAETRARLWYAPLADAMRDVDDLFIRYKMGRERKTGDVLRAGIGDAVGATGGKMTRLEFAEAVGRAMRREDDHPVPEVKAAAASMRARVFEPLKQEAIKLGLLPEDVTPETAASYLSRVYDKPRIAAQRPEFENRLTTWLTQTQKQSEMRQAEAQKAMTSASADIQKFTEAGRIDLRDAEMRLDKSRLEFVATDRELKLRDRRLRGLQKALNKAAERAEKLAPDAKLPADDEWVQLMRDVRKPPKEPTRLSRWIAGSGGLKDSGGELKAMDAAKRLPGLVNNKDGMTLDDATQAVWDAGYLNYVSRRGSNFERPTIDELLTALRDDLADSPVYSHLDEEALTRREAAASFAEELESRGIDYARMSDEEVLARYEDRTFKANTAVRREKVRETERQASRMREMLDKEAAALKEVQAKWDNLRAEIDFAQNDLTLGRSAKEALKRAERKAERAAARLEMERWTANASEAELRDVSRQITDQILGNSEARTSYLPFAVKTRGPLMERTLLIDDMDIEEFLESDVFRVAKFYARTMGTDVELTRAFGRADMADQIDTINEDYAIKRAQVKDGDERRLAKLEERRMDDIRTLEAIRDRVRGTYARPGNPDALLIRAGRSIRNLNYVRLLGGATVSSLSDMARAVTLHGFQRTFADGLGPLLANRKGYRLAAKEARMAAAAIDTELDMRAQMMADIWDEYGRGTMVERGLSQMSSSFGRVSLLGPWTDFWKGFNAVMSQSRTIEALKAKAAGGASKAEIERLAFLGLSDELQDRIAGQIDRYGKDVNGLQYANSGAWDDVEAVTAFRAAILKEANLAIIQPGQEKPLWMSTQLGAFIGQFRSFTFSAMTRIAVSGLQQRDAAALGGIVLSVGLGMMAYAAKAWIAGKELSDDPNKWVLEGFDNSGVTGWVFEANNILDKVSGGGFSLQGAMDTELERYRARSPLEVLLGPSASAASNVGEVFNSAIGNGEWTEADTRRVRQLLPYQNVFYLRFLFDVLAGEDHTMGQSIAEVPGRD